MTESAAAVFDREESRAVRRDRYHKNWPLTMDRAELLEVPMWTCTTPGFLAEVYQTGSARPMFPKEQHGKPCTRGPLMVTLLELYRCLRRYGKHKNSTAIDVWQMVVCDATFGVFKIVLNSGLQDIPHEDLHPGANLIIAENDWRIIYNKKSSEGLLRGVCFVTNLDYDMAPGTISEESKEDGHVTPDPNHTVAWIDAKAIQKVKEESLMLFLDSYQHEEGFFYWYRMESERIRRGDFISAPEDAHNFTQMRGKRERDKEACSCQEAPHFFEDCIELLHPLTEVDVVDLFDEVRGKMKGRVVAESFEDLSSSHKRWCLYWYYAVNFFHMGGGDAQELPKCFVAAVRKKYPDEAGNYTGFKSKDERSNSTSH